MLTQKSHQIQNTTSFTLLLKHYTACPVQFIIRLILLIFPRLVGRRPAPCSGAPPQITPQLTVAHSREIGARAARDLLPHAIGGSTVQRWAGTAPAAKLVPLDPDRELDREPVAGRGGAWRGVNPLTFP